MDTKRQINIAEIIDEGAFSWFQIRAVSLCVFIALIEGFDTQLLGFVAPVIIEDWGLSETLFGSVFSASLFGLMVGSFALGRAGDKIGRKNLLLVSFAMVGLFTILSAYAGNLRELVIYRFLTGLALGGTIPNAITLVSEYAPKRFRALSITIMICGFPLGGVIGGIFFAPWIAEIGWRQTLLFGGILPLVLSVALFMFLPESIRFLASKSKYKKQTSQLLARIDKKYIPGAADNFTAVCAQPNDSELQIPGGRFVDIFSEGRFVGTLLLWVLFITNLLMLHLIMSWLPTIIIMAGFELSKAIIATSVFSAGGIISGIMIGRAIDRSSPYFILGGTYGFAAIIAVLLSFGTSSFPLLLLLIFCGGMGMLGPQLAINALAANFYPSEIRSTGVGAALSAGRIGAILGPLIGGAMLSLGLPISRIFFFLIVPASICGGIVLILRLQTQKNLAKH